MNTVNPIYSQVFYDGGQKTSIRTLQNHRNQKVHDDFIWGYKEDPKDKKFEKITSTQFSQVLGQIPLKLPSLKYKDNDIFNVDEDKKKTIEGLQIVPKYSIRYAKQSQIYFGKESLISPLSERYSSSQIGSFHNGSIEKRFIMPPIREPVERYKNRSTVCLK